MNIKKISKLGNTLRLNKRGVSPIIATLLLVAIAVAAAVVTYTWTMSLAQNNSQQAQTSVKVDIVEFDSSTSAVVTFRNTGSIAATIDVVYTYAGDALIDTELTNQVIQSGSTEEYTLSFAAPLDVNEPYRIRAITTTGFVVEGTYYTPGSFS